MTVTLPPALARLLTIKGQNVTLQTIRPVKVRKGCEPIMKDAAFVCRVGIDHDNRAIVQAGREDGTLPAENMGLAWGEWYQFPYLISHNDRLYFRVYPSSDPNAKREAIYTRNGSPVAFDDVKADFLASELREKAPTDCYNIPIDTIVSVNGEPVWGRWQTTV